jgi:DNA-directed RNA polymerase subunit M/transcription elongation factor TFIIS
MNSDSTEIHFCSECQNMTYLYINEEKELIHYCKACCKIEPFENKNNCIYSVNFKKYDNSELINNNQYITHDITIPKIENNIHMKCINDDCPSNEKQTNPSISYIKYDMDDMKYIYICNDCGQKWKNQN